MDSLVIHRDEYGQPAKSVKFEEIPVPRLQVEDATKALIAVLATGPNFNTNFAALGLPVPVFGRGDSSTIHIPGSDALGIRCCFHGACRLLSRTRAVKNAKGCAIHRELEDKGVFVQSRGKRTLKEEMPDPARGEIYKPPKPQDSSYYQCVEDHFDSVN